MAFDLEETYVIAAEESLGAKLPESYRIGMMQANGDSIETEEDDWELFPILDKSDRKRIARTCNHLLQESESFREWSNFPEGALAIGSNSCGDCLLFLMKDGKFIDVIYEWSHETGELNEVASNFSDLERI